MYITTFFNEYPVDGSLVCCTSIVKNHKNTIENFCNGKSRYRAKFTIVVCVNNILYFIERYLIPLNILNNYFAKTCLNK